LSILQKIFLLIDDKFVPSVFGLKMAIPFLLLWFYYYFKIGQDDKPVTFNAVSINVRGLALITTTLLYYRKLNLIQKLILLFFNGECFAVPFIAAYFLR
jgi:hypothetical protein